MNRWKRRLALLLTVVMLLSLVPPSAFADETNSVATPAEQTGNLLGGSDDTGEADNGGDAGEADSGGDTGEADSGEDAGEVDNGGDAGEADSGGDAGEADNGENAGESGNGDAGESGGGDAGGPNGGGGTAAKPNNSGEKIGYWDEETDWNVNKAPAAEISYNLTGSGYWITVGSDKDRAEKEDAYGVFSTKQDGTISTYTIQMRKEDVFPYTVEIRYRESADGQWSVPKKIEINSFDSEIEYAGHILKASSKWLMEIQYTATKNLSGTVGSEKFDENGGYAIPLNPGDIMFPLSVSFRYRTRPDVEADYGDWRDPPEKEMSHDFTGMKDSFEVMGHRFTLTTKGGGPVGTVQYSLYTRDQWVTVGPGERNEFDAHGNYTIDLGDTKNFPVPVYMRYMDTDGWKYLDDVESESESVKRYANVLDSATIGGHVFSIHTNWMNDVRFALVNDSTAFTDQPVKDADGNPAMGEDGKPKTEKHFNPNAPFQWFKVGEDKDESRGNAIDGRYDSEGNYVIDMDTDLPGLMTRQQVFPFRLVFQAIGPTGQWESAENWEKDGKLDSHILSFATAEASQTFEGHKFSLTTGQIGDVTYTLYHTKHSFTEEPATEEGGKPVEKDTATQVQDLTGKLTKKDFREKKKKGFAEDGSFVFKLTPVDTFPVKVTFSWLETDGSKHLTWEIKDLSKLKDGRASTEVAGHTFVVEADFLDNIRFRRNYASWATLSPSADGAYKNAIGSVVSMVDDAGKKSIDIQNADGKSFEFHYSNSEYDEPIQLNYEKDGGFTYPFTDAEKKGSGLFVNKGTAEKPSFELNPPLIIQTWDCQRGWTDVEMDPFHHMGDSRKITTAAGVEHVFRLQGAAVEEIRYRAHKNDEWTTVGKDKARAEENPDLYLYSEGLDFAIPLAEEDKFPLQVEFEIATDKGWIKPDGDQTPNGVGTFDSASAKVAVKQGDGNRTVSLQYPWANSVRLTFPDRIPQSHITVGPDKAYAEKDDTYFYAAAGSAFAIDMEEGDFFPFKVQFAVRDNKGVLKGVSGSETHLGETEKEEDYTCTFTKNEPSEVYEKGGYKFSAHSYWMDTVRVHLPERTFSVGLGQNLPEGWLEQHPNYRLYQQEHQTRGFPIPLVSGDKFPLEVEFMLRKVTEPPKPEKLTFNKVSDTTEFGGFKFRLDSDYTDTVRYIVATKANGDDIADEKGVLKETYVGNQDFIPVTVVSDMEWAANHKEEHYAAFDEDGNFQIPLGRDDALPVDVWFALPDENGAFEKSTYKKVTFTERTSSATIPEKKTDETPDYGPHHTFTVGADWMDEVTYTLPQVPKNDSLPVPKPVTVGIDKDRAEAEAKQAREERRNPLYAAYDEDGSYTIELEEDAFFPYVVKVEYRLAERTEKMEPVFGKDGKTQMRDRFGQLMYRNNPYKGEIQNKTEWIQFSAPDAQIELNGHIFKVHSPRKNPRAAVRIDLELGEHTIPLRLAGMPGSLDNPLLDKNQKPIDTLVATAYPPAPNPNTGMGEDADTASLLSTQPLTEVQLSADLTGVFNLELEKAHVLVYKWNFERDREELAEFFVWGEWQMENYDKNTGTWTTDKENVKYRVLGTGERNKPLDLSGYASTKRQDQYFEVITGSLDQLDMENIRYVIKTSMKYPQSDGLLDMQFAYTDDMRSSVSILSKRYEHPEVEKKSYYEGQGYFPPGLTTLGEESYYFERDGQTYPVDVYRLTVDETWRDGTLWMTMKRNNQSQDYQAFKSLTADIYEGFYLTAEEAAKSGKNLVGSQEGQQSQEGQKGRTISDMAWEKELNTQRVADRYAYSGPFVNGPAGIADGPKFTIVWKRGDVAVSLMRFRVLVDVRTVRAGDDENPGDGQKVDEQVPIYFYPPHTYNRFIPDENGNYPETTYLEQILGSETLDSETGMVTTLYWTQTQGSLYDDRYYVIAEKLGKWKNETLTVYAGKERYATLEEAKEAAARTDSTRAVDVTKQLIREDPTDNKFIGFGADFSSDYSSGVVFSVFDEKGELVACRKIQTMRREFLYFGPLEGSGIDKVENNIALENLPYSKEVNYDLPDSEYRGIYKGKSEYVIPVAYLRDYVPSDPQEAGVKIVAADQRYETYETAMQAMRTVQGNPDDLRVIADITDQMTEGEVYGKKALVIKYRAPYRNGIHFNLYDRNGILLDYRIVTAYEPKREGDTYFRATGAQSVNGREYLSYLMPGNMDGYHSHGYQTIFLLNKDETPVTDNKIIPIFEYNEMDEWGNKNQVYGVKKANDDTGGVLQTSGETQMDFQGDGTDVPIHYMVSSANEEDRREYWVTYLTQQEGKAQLFVNTANGADHQVDDPDHPGQKIVRRDVFIQKSSGMYHDIFIANIGDQPLEGINVTFAKGEKSNLFVDDYWTIRDDASDTTSARTLGVFDSVAASQPAGRGRYDNGFYWTPDVMPSNVAKIRIYPKKDVEQDEIDDVLIISTKNGGTTRLKISGTIGEQRITTEALTGPKAKAPSEKYDDYSLDPVLYVGFSRMIGTTWTLDKGVRFSVTAGRLPDGFPVGYRRDEASKNDQTQQIQPNGELYGVPLETGTFTFTVTATFQFPADVPDPIYSSEDSKTYTINVLDNTDYNVWSRISDEYGVLSWIPDLIINVPDGQEEAGVNNTAAPLGEAGGSRKQRTGVPAVTLTEYQPVQFKYEVEDGVTNGVEDYEWAWEVYLNGIRLTENKDYRRWPGSDTVTLDAQTVKDKAKANERNTLDVYQREDGKSTSTWTKNASTNFTVTDNKKAQNQNNNQNQNQPAPVNNNTGGGGSNSRRTTNTTPVPPAQTYSVTTSNTANGSLKSVGSQRAGDRVTVTGTPKDGYQFSGVSVKDAKGNAVPATRNANGTFSFTMPGSKVTVTPTFIPRLTIEQPEHGKLSINRTSAAPGTRVTITAKPENGYVAEAFSAWVGRDEYIQVNNNGDGTATFTMPDRPVYVGGRFGLDPGLPVTDISPKDWFYEDARWAYRRGILVGVTDTSWVPEDSMSSATAVVTLARLAGADLAEYQEANWAVQADSGSYSWIPGEWYAPEARWAATNHILTEDIFTGREALPRAYLALMLRRFLVQQGVVVEAPAEQAVFADADTVRTFGPDVEEAFQILYQVDVFRGDSTKAMLPNAYTKRSHLAATLHRLSDFIIGYWEEKEKDADAEQNGT